jgi:hypothetical protein
MLLGCVLVVLHLGDGLILVFWMIWSLDGWLADRRMI